MIHLEMNPKYLFNKVFWSEPELPQSDESDENSEKEFESPAARDIRRIGNIMKRHAAGKTKVSIPLVEIRQFGHKAFQPGFGQFAIHIRQNSEINQNSDNIAII